MGSALLDGGAPPREAHRVSFGAPGELVFRQLGAHANYLARVSKQRGSGLERVLDDPIDAIQSMSPDGVWAAGRFTRSRNCQLES